MTNDFAKIITRYFGRYLIDDRGCSPQTIETYRYAFIQFINYMDSVKKIKPEKISMHDFNFGNVNDFLAWIEKELHVSISTRNTRLAAFKGFASYVKYEYPDYLAEAVQILKIKSKKKETGEISYVTNEGMQHILRQIDRGTRTGQRDYTMFALMYSTGIRVSELINIRGQDVSLVTPKSITIHGKGGKVRYVAIVKQLPPILEHFLNENKCLLPQNLTNPIFTNHSQKQFTRQGINQRLKTYVAKARESSPLLVSADFSPHKIRHSTAMALMEEGTELIIVRDLLGHVSVQTTEIYAKASTARKRKAIEAHGMGLVEEEVPLWESNRSVLEWLIGMKKRNIM